MTPTLIFALSAAVCVLAWHTRTLRRQNARIRAHAWGHWEALVLGHAANDASPPRATAGGNTARFTMDLDTSGGVTRYRLLDGGVVVRSGWVSDAGMLSAEFERFCGERTGSTPCARAASEGAP